MLWNRDRDGVARALATMERFKPNGAPWVDLTSLALEEALAAFDDGSDPTFGMQRSVELADHVGPAFDAAFLRLDVAFLPGVDDGLKEYSLAAARERFLRLGADGLWARLNELQAKKATNDV